MAVRVPALPNPVHLRLRTTDVELCREVLLNGLYDYELCDKPSAIVDAGANIGLVSVSYASRYPSAKIIALEPESSNFEMLRKNAAFYPNITPLRAALWNKNTKLNLVDPGLGHTTYQTRETRAQAASSKDSLVAAITINKLMAEFDIGFIDFLKVNIEGAEKEVFESAADWIRHVGVIAMDLHEDIRPGSSGPVLAATQGFEVSWQQGAITVWARKDSVPRERHLAGSRTVLQILNSPKSAASRP